MRSTPRLRLALVLALTTAVAAAGCRLERPPVPDAEREAIADSIVELVKAAYDLSKPNVVERLMSLYPDSGRIVSAAGGRVITSRDSLQAGIRYFWENVGRNMQQPQWIWDRMLIDVPSTRVAVLTATYHVPHRTPQGQPHEIGGAWTAVFTRRGDRWVIVQEHLSDWPVAPDSASAAPVAVTP